MTKPEIEAILEKAECPSDMGAWISLRGDAERLARHALGLREALVKLLEDSQHSEHYCRDSDCPVDTAHKVLEGS